MRYQNPLFPVSLMALAIPCAALAQPSQPMPRLEKRGAVTQLIVDGKPWLSLAGELLNNATSTADNVRPVWVGLAKMNLNTVLVEAGTPPQKTQLGNYVFDFATGRGWGSATASPAPAPAAESVTSVAGTPQPSRRPPLPNRGYAILMQAGTSEFWIAGANLNVKFASNVAASPQASLASVEEGRFENDAWVVDRHLAGDDIGMGGDDRASLRLTAEPRILHFSLYSYR